MVLVCALAVTALPAFAGPELACETLFALELEQSKATEAKAIKQPKTAIARLNAFKAELSIAARQSGLRNATVAHQQVAQLLHELERADKVLGGDQALVGSGMFWGLHTLLGSPAVRGIRQECGIIMRDMSPVTGLAPLVSLKFGSYLKVVLWLVGLPAALAAITALIRHLLRSAALRERQSKRLICKIPAFLYYGNACTKTMIVDISQTGIKVIASHQDLGHKYVGVHFAGQAHKAKEKWRNKLYAAYKFQTPITEQELQAALATSTFNICDAGIEKTAPACYHDGCEVGCSKHMAPALPLKA
ncbi:PilZ domain-containing protein [Pseudorhodobacter sp. E13]|nr:PilZ domain-containing protein [Pseudorhodobacter sp. E13]